jgi:integrase
MQLFDAEGRRLYVTEEERRAFVAAAAKAPREVRTFCGVLHATGCRISEALALTTQQIDLSARGRVREPEEAQARTTGRGVLGNTAAAAPRPNPNRGHRRRS